ncbi:hypothetical protein M0804_014714, partial [Polistes exclamans]
MQIKEEDSKMGISIAENRVANIKPINKSINCSYCKKDGHLKDSCWQKKGGERRQSPPAFQRASQKSSSETGTVGIRQVKYNPRNCIKPLTKIDGSDSLHLTRITLEKQSTLGTLFIHIFGEDVLFHVVDENFPIHFDGILGMEFLGSRSAIIDNTLGCLNFKNRPVPFSRSESVCIPSRSSKISYCYVKNLEISEGYMPLLRLPAGIYAGESLIKNNNGKGFFRITNTTSEQYMFEVPRLKLSDFSDDTLLNSGSDTGKKTTDPDSSEILSFIHTIFTEKNGEGCPKLNTFEIVNRPGSANLNADALTRNRSKVSKVLLVGASDSGDRLIQFETKDNQTDDEDSDIEIDIDNTNILDKTAGKFNDLTESLCALTDTGKTGGVCSDTGSTCDYFVLYSPQHTRVDTHTQMLTSNMGITRKPLILRKDSLVIFTDLEGTPCDAGAKLLSESKLLPKLKDLTSARAK